MLKKLCALGAPLLLSACGTTMTLVDTDGVVSAGLSRSRCDSIPYIYSGVGYDYCFLNGDPPARGPRPVLRNGKPDSGSITWSSSSPFILIDFLISGVADTIALPYTVYRNSQGDRILVKHK